MSHYIIINGVKKFLPHEHIVATEDDPGSLSYEVKYTPAHDTSLREQNHRIGRIRQLLAKAEAVAAGEAEPNDT